jgi:hypothetical protein
MDDGFNVIEDTDVEEHGLASPEDVSCIQFLRSVRRENMGQFEDYSVDGFDYLVLQVDKYDDVAEYMKELFRKHGIDQTGNTYQFVVDTDQATVGVWQDKPAIVSKDNKKYSLFKVFKHMEMQEDNPNWYRSQLNIDS